MKSLDNSPFLSIGYVFPLGEKVHPLPVSPLLAPDGGYLSCPLVGGGWEVEEGGSGGGCGGGSAGGHAGGRSGGGSCGGGGGLVDFSEDDWSVEEERVGCRRRSFDSMIEKILRENSSVQFDCANELKVSRHL